MTRGTWTTRERSVVAACAIGAVAMALLLPLVWRLLVDHPVARSLEVAMWVTTVLTPVPACLALAGVVLTARPVGTAIAVVSGLALLVANLQELGAFRSMIGTRDYVLWVVWAVVLGCALLGADALAWRLRSFRVATGILAGFVVAVLETAVKLSMVAFGPDGLYPGIFPVEFWVREYAVPGLMLVVAGALAGAAAGRVVVPQETAGLS